MSESGPRRGRSNPGRGGSPRGGRPAGRSGGRSGSGRGAGGRSTGGNRGTGGRTGRSGDGRRSDGRRDGRDDGRPSSGRGGRPGGTRGADKRGSDGRRGGERSGRRADDRGDRTYGRPEPRTEAERRAAEVRKTRGPRRTPQTPESERAKIEGRETEEWIDEGSVRDEAVAATQRAVGGRSRPAPEVDPEVAAKIGESVDPRRAARLTERLASASAALDRERFDEARRMVAPLVRELPDVAAVHEVSGLAAYRLGRWKEAAQSLELARQLHADPHLLPVLADSYRGSAALARRGRRLG